MLKNNYFKTEKYKILDFRLTLFKPQIKYLEKNENKKEFCYLNNRLIDNFYDNHNL